MAYSRLRFHFIALICLAVSLATQSYAEIATSPQRRPANECLVGDDGTREIDNLLKGKVPSFNDALLKEWRELPYNDNGYRTWIPKATYGPAICHDKQGKPLTLEETMVRELADITSVASPQRFVRRDCVARAINRIPGMSGDFIACGLKGINHKQRGLIMAEHEKKLSGTPCVTEDYVDYVHWTLNQVINCLSDPGEPIDPDVIFNKLSRESAFAAFYRWPGGRGIAQMTTEAINEMNPGKDGYTFLMERMRKNEAACKKFEHIINPPVIKGEIPTNSCRYVSMGDGLARNLLHGIGLYLYYRNYAYGPTAEKVLVGLGFKDNPDFVRMRDYLTLMAFNLGNTGMKNWVMKRGIGRPKERAKMKFADFKKAIDQQPYMRQVQATADEVLGDPPISCSEGAW